MLTVVHDADSSNEDAGSSRSLLDEIVRDGARQMLAAAGLNCVAEGSGTVQSQSVPAGESVQRGTIVTITCG